MPDVTLGQVSEEGKIRFESTTSLRECGILIHPAVPTISLVRLKGGAEEPFAFYFVFLRMRFI